MKPHLLHGSRSRILAGVILVIAGIFVVRLFQLQVIQYEYYKQQAMEEQTKRERIPATRGEIYAMNGDEPRPLVKNETVYTVFVDPAVITDTREVTETLKEVAGGNVRTGFEDLLEMKESRYQIVADKVTRVQADKIKEAGLYGVGFQAVSQRVYPEGSLAAQVLGFVNAEGKGNYGVEGYLNQDLTGVDGRLVTVKDVSDVPLTIGNQNIREPAQNGNNVVLTIDRNVQSQVEQIITDAAGRLGADVVSAVVMDPNTGKVLAMANTPSYTPAEYYKQTDAAIFNNDVISGVYEPGSTIKTFTMATAIDKGVAHADDTYNNTDSITVQDRTISNAVRGHTGVISFQTALSWSLNTGFVTLGQRLGDGKSITPTARQTMYEYFHDRFKLGEKTGVQLAAESGGSIISPESTEGNEVRYANMTFGQGMSTTMLQVTAGFCSVVNGGNYYKPTVVNGYMVDGEYKPEANPQPTATGLIAESTSSEMRSMLQTARQLYGDSRRDKGGYMIGGKTGTAQMATNGVYSDTETYASYIGFGGSQDDPEYVIMVSMHGKDKAFEGGRNALPIFTDISNWMLDYLKVQPKG